MLGALIFEKVIALKISIDTLKAFIPSFLFVHIFLLSYKEFNGFYPQKFHRRLPSISINRNVYLRSPEERNMVGLFFLYLG
jgi:hypothetical protein